LSGSICGHELEHTEKTSKQGCVGIDVSARTLVVAGAGWPVRELANTAAGHQQLQQMLREGGGRTRVCVEASGNYSLDVSLLLHRLPQVELSVIRNTIARAAPSNGGRASAGRAIPGCGPLSTCPIWWRCSMNRIWDAFISA
jgi:hypothetical protein